MSEKAVFENTIVSIDEIVVDGDWPVDSTLRANIDAEGLIQPIVLIEFDGALCLHDGRRRLACARSLGWKTIEARVARWSLLAGDMLTLSGNIRAGNPLSEARAIKRLGDNGICGDDLRLYSGKNIKARGKLLSLLKLSEGLQKMVETGALPVTAGYALAKLKSHSDQERALASATAANVRRKATVSDIEYAVADVLHVINPVLPLPPPVLIDARGERFAPAILVDALRQCAARMPRHRAKVLEEAAQELEKEIDDG